MAGYDIPTSSIQIAKELLTLIKQHDEGTFQHCVRVSRLSSLLAKAAGLDADEIRSAEFAGLFHDIGKSKIPKEILLKPGRLTPDETIIMQKHSSFSADMLDPLKNIEFYSRLIEAVRLHHERFDGEGYPFQIKGEDIPLISRIILVVDTYDSMTWTRPYRKGLPANVAYKEIQTYAGTQFDPQLAKIFNEAHPKWDVIENGSFKEMNQTVLSGLEPTRIISAARVA